MNWKKEKYSAADVVEISTLFDHEPPQGEVFGIWRHQQDAPFYYANENRNIVHVVDDDHLSAEMTEEGHVVELLADGLRKSCMPIDEDDLEQSALIFGGEDAVVGGVAYDMDNRAAAVVSSCLEVFSAFGQDKAERDEYRVAWWHELIKFFHYIGQSGHATYAMIGDYLPGDAADAEDAVECVAHHLREMGVQVYEKAQHQDEPTLRIYIREVGSPKPLSREDEGKIMRRIEDGVCRIMQVLSYAPRVVEEVLADAALISEEGEQAEKVIEHIFDAFEVANSDGDEMDPWSAALERWNMEVLDKGEAMSLPESKDGGLKERTLKLMGQLRTAHDKLLHSHSANMREEQQQKITAIMTRFCYPEKRVKHFINMMKEVIGEVKQNENRVREICINKMQMARADFWQYYPSDSLEADWFAAVPEGKYNKNADQYIPEIRHWQKASQDILKKNKIPHIMVLRRMADDLSRHEDKVKQAKKELVHAHMHLVIPIAKKYAGHGLPLLDLIQEGNLGLIKAADRFQHWRGVRFSVYATLWLHQSVGRAAADKGSMIRIPVHMVETIRKLNRISWQLLQKNGTKASPEQLAKGMDMPVDRVRLIIKTPKEPISMDIPMGDATIGSLVEDESAVNLDVTVANSHRSAHLHRFLRDHLSEREAQILEMRHGINIDRDYTLQEVGNEMGGVTRERIRQIEKRALRKLQKHAAELEKILGKGYPPRPPR